MIELEPVWQGCAPVVFLGLVGAGFFAFVGTGWDRELGAEVKVARGRPRFVRGIRSVVEQGQTAETSFIN